MEQQQLFEYSIFRIPTEKEAEKGKKAEILVAPKTIIANNDKSAFMIAVRDIPEKYAKDDMDQIKIAVRPF
jgi:P pilus assembly chaperone PapD